MKWWYNIKSNKFHRFSYSFRFRGFSFSIKIKVLSKSLQFFQDMLFIYSGDLGTPSDLLRHFEKPILCSGSVWLGNEDNGIFQLIPLENQRGDLRFGWKWEYFFQKFLETDRYNIMHGLCTKCTCTPPERTQYTDKLCTRSAPLLHELVPQEWNL